MAGKTRSDDTDGTDEMLISVENDPRPYAWGSRTDIAELLGRAPSGEPEAELWLGAHPGSPARIAELSAERGHPDLRAWIEADPATALGLSLAATGRLPFLLKVLAAAAPLSLQAHPTPEQARTGYDRENRLGIVVDDPRRNYRDPFHKPEVVVALSETFDALCGFRSVDEVRQILEALVRLDASSPVSRPDLLGLLRVQLDSREPLRSALAWILSGADEVAELVAHLVALSELADVQDATVAGALETVRDLARWYPGDAGIAASLLVQRVTMRRGEALYLPAGNIHAYIRGLGIELMAASDNVLRGGLTSKHIDVPELLRVLDFRHLPVPFLVPEEPVPGVRVFRPDVPDFVLVHVKLDREAVELPLDGPAVVLSVRGSAKLAGRRGYASMGRGECVYVTPDEISLTVRGEGELFVATTGCRSGEVKVVSPGRVDAMAPAVP